MYDTTTFARRTTTTIHPSSLASAMASATAGARRPRAFPCRTRTRLLSPYLSRSSSPSSRAVRLASAVLLTALAGLIGGSAVVRGQSVVLARGSDGCIDVAPSQPTGLKVGGSGQARHQCGLLRLAPDA